MPSGAGPRAAGVNDNEPNLHHPPVSSPTEERLQWKMREDQAGILWCVLCCIFSFVFVYFITKVFKRLPVPASFFQIYELRYEPVMYIMTSS